MSDASTPSVTAGLQSIAAFARDVNRSERTIARWIKRGLPVVYFGSTPLVDPPKARRWFEQGMPPPSRTPRQPRARDCDGGPVEEGRETMPRSLTLQNAYEIVARSLREFGYPDTTADMIRDTHNAMKSGAVKMPHGIVGMFAKGQLEEVGDALDQLSCNRRPDAYK